jgi:hypothetical protein
MFHVSLRHAVFVRGLIAALLLVAPLSTASAAVLIEIDKAAQQMKVSVDGRTRWTWPVSTGRAGYDTPGGSFRAFRMEEDHYSKEFDEAPMPHSIFFTKTGHAIHGSFDVKNIGRPASHGCVRLQPENAAKLYALVQAEGVLNTTVVLTGQIPRSAPLVASPRIERQAPTQIAPAQAYNNEPRFEREPNGYSRDGYARDGYAYERRPLYAPRQDYPVAQEAYRPRRYLFDPY